MSLRSIASVLILVAMYVITDGALGKAQTYEGYVEDFVYENRVEGAIVTIEGISDTTDHEGYFHINLNSDVPQDTNKTTTRIIRQEKAEIYNVLGQKLKTILAPRNNNLETITWNGTGRSGKVADGMYFASTYYNEKGKLIRGRTQKIPVIGGRPQTKIDIRPTTIKRRPYISVQETDTTRINIQHPDSTYAEYNTNIISSYTDTFVVLPMFTNNQENYDIESLYQLFRNDPLRNPGKKNMRHNYNNPPPLVSIDNSEFQQSEIDSIITVVYDVLPPITRLPNGTSWADSTHLDSSIYVYDFHDPPDTLPTTYTNGVVISADRNMPWAGKNGYILEEDNTTLYVSWVKLKTGNNRRTTTSELADCMFGGEQERYGLVIWSIYDNEDPINYVTPADSIMTLHANTRPIGSVMNQFIQGDTTYVETDPEPQRALTHGCGSVGTETK